MPTVSVSIKKTIPDSFSTSSFATISTVATTTKKTTPDSLKSKQLPKLGSATTKQSSFSATSKDLILSVGINKTPLKFKISENDDNTVAAFGSSSNFCDQKQVNKAFQKHVADNYPGREVLNHE